MKENITSLPRRQRRESHGLRIGQTLQDFTKYFISISCAGYNVYLAKLSGHSEYLMVNSYLLHLILYKIYIFAKHIRNNIFEINDRSVS